MGGVAATLYGIPRMTADLDIVMELSRENIENLLRAMEKLDLKPAIPVAPEELLDEDKRKEWIEKKHMVVFSFVNPEHPFEVLDILINPPIPFKELYSRKNIFNAEGEPIPVVCIEDLIRLKTISGRKQDLSDIEILREIKNG